jgi:hypothetical protein
MNKNTEATPWLPRRELGVGNGRGEVGGGSRVREPDDRTVDVDSRGAVGSRPTCGRVEARQQIGPGGRQVEDDDLIDLPRVESRGDGLLGPQTELRIPQRAVRLGMPGVGQGGEIPEYVEEIAPIAQGVDQGRVLGGGILARMTVAHQVHKPLGLRVVGARLPIDEAEEPLAGGPEKVVAAVVCRVVQRGHVGRTLQHRSQGLARVRAEVHNRLAGVEALDKQQVGVGLQELPGRRRRGCDVDAQDAITRVGVVDDVERTVAGSHDRSVVDDRRSGDTNKRAISRAGHGPRLELGEREAVGSRHRDTGGTEIRRALEVDQRWPERILRWRGVVNSHGLHAGGAADREIGELGRKVHAQVMRQPGVGGIQEDEPGGLAIGLPFVQWQAHRLGGEIDLDGALLGQVVPGQQTTHLS